MSIWITEGFDYADNAADTEPKWLPESSWTQDLTGRFGGRCANLNSTIYYASITSQDPGTTNELIVGFAMKRLGYTAYDVLRFYDDTTEMLAIECQTDGTLSAIVSGSPVSTTTGKYIAGVWQYFEVKVLLKGTAVGSVAWQIDGVVDTVTPTITTITAGTSCDKIRFVGGSTNNAWQVDDIYIGDSSGTTDFLGDVQIVTLFPNADDAVQYTRSSGSFNYEMVDDLPQDNDGTYNQADTSGFEDTFDFASFGIGGGDTIHAVGVNVHHTKVDAGAANIYAVTKSGGTSYTSSAITAAVGYQLDYRVWIEDPNGDIAWTSTNLDAAKFGYQRV
jgi:hypothetical protein